MNHQEEISRLAEEIEAMKERHSVRQYEKKPLTKEIISERCSGTAGRDQRL